MNNSQLFLLGPRRMRIEVEGSSTIGQAFIEDLDTLPEAFQNEQVGIRLRLKLTDPSHGKKVRDNLKGLFVMLKMDPFYEEIDKILKVDFPFDDNYVYIDLKIISWQDFKNLLLKMHFFYSEEYVPKYNEYPGRTKVKVSHKFNLIDLLKKDFDEFIDNAFVFTLEGYSETQLNAIFRNYTEDCEKHNRLNIDLISEKIETPVYKFLKNYTGGQKIDFNEKYSEALFRNIVREYNSNYEGLNGDYNKFQHAGPLAFIAVLQERSKGFFKPYFNILKCINFNELSGLLFVREIVTRFEGNVKIKGINEFIEETFFNN